MFNFWMMLWHCLQTQLIKMETYLLNQEILKQKKDLRNEPITAYDQHFITIIHSHTHSYINVITQFLKLLHLKVNNGSHPSFCCGEKVRLFFVSIQAEGKIVYSNLQMIVPVLFLMLCQVEEPNGDHQLMGIKEGVFLRGSY